MSDNKGVSRLSCDSQQELDISLIQIRDILISAVLLQGEETQLTD